jgi:hypothetical protein
MNNLRTIITFASLLTAAACEPADPPSAGFGAECQYNADCGDGYVCLDATCVPDDVEAPDPLGDGVDAPPTRPVVEFEVPDCDALLARYPEAEVCELSVRIGDAAYDSQEAVPPGTPADLAGCEIVMGQMLLLEGSPSSLSFLSDLKGICGHLHIEDRAVTSLEGLGQLTHVVGNVELSNIGVRDLDALSNLEEVRELTLARLDVDDLAGLSSLRRAEKLWLYKLPQVSSLAGLSGLVEVNRAYLTELEGLVTLDGLEALAAVHRTLEVERCTGLVDASALDGLGGLPARIAFEQLPSLGALPELSRPVLPVGDDFVASVTLSDLPLITSWPMAPFRGHLFELVVVATGMSELDLVEGSWSVGELVISNNASLDDITALHALTEAGSVAVYDNPGLDNCELEALFDPMTETAVTIYGNGGQPACAP